MLSKMESQRIAINNWILVTWGCMELILSNWEGFLNLEWGNLDETAGSILKNVGQTIKMILEETLKEFRTGKKPEMSCI